MKAPRGCEYLKALAVESGKFDQIQAAAPSGKALKGNEPQGRRHLMALGFAEGQSFWGTKDSGWRLGAWATSEGEPKPTRGSRNNFTVFLGT